MAAAATDRRRPEVTSSRLPPPGEGNHLGNDGGKPVQISAVILTHQANQDHRTVVAGAGNTAHRHELTP